MAADITRSTFNPAKHYSGVRQQQGRVSLDADWNEQVDIAAHRVVTETADVVGTTGAPRDNAAFQMVRLPQQGPSSDIAFSPGRMYVEGFLCELESTSVPILISGTAQVQLSSMIVDDREFAVGQWVEISASDPTSPAPLLTPVQAVSVGTQTLTLTPNIGGFTGKSGLQLRRITTYLTQPDSPSPAPLPTTGFALAYLDVWQRTVTAIEDSEIREPALGPSSGADTATRTRTVCQVKFQPIGSNVTCASAPDFATFIPPSTAQLAARAEPTAPATSACILPPRAGFRRLENQLYRVEIHAPGNVASGGPTFKWSRDNGSIVTTIVLPAPVLSGTTLTLNVGSLGRDPVLGFARGQWVELIDDARELQGKHGILVQLTSAAVGPQGPVLTADTKLADAADLSAFLTAFSNSTIRNPKVRRWDQFGAQVSATAPGGDVKVREGVWIDLESGVQVFFQPGANYQTGDYWLVPARTVTGDVDWLRDSSGNPQFLSPLGIRHHHCRLGIVSFSGPTWAIVSDCRDIFAPAAEGGIHIEFVFLTNASQVSPNGGLVLNDSSVSLQDLAGGLSVVCDTPIDPVSILANPPSNTSLIKPTCLVSIDVPNFVGPGQAAFARQPMIVSATLGLDNTGTTIIWTPTAAAASWIQTQLSQILAQTPSPGPLLAHLTLKGNFIWARGNPSLYLDGESFGSPVPPDTAGNQRTDIGPSGDGRRGGDFEMWFWLISLPAVVVSPTSVDFGTQAVNSSSPVNTLTLTNNTKAALTISSIFASGDFAQTTTCPVAPTTLAAAQSCTISATFTPTQGGLRTGAITVAHSAAGSPLIIPLTGTGLAAGLLASATTLIFRAQVGADFGDTRTLTLTNSGSSPLIISGIPQVSGPASGDYEIGGPCLPAPGATTTTLQPGQSCTIDVTFTPGSTGPRNAIMTITHNATGSPLVITLKGTGTKPPPPPRVGGLAPPPRIGGLLQ
jgi:hypothetical protein